VTRGEQLVRYCAMLVRQPKYRKAFAQEFQCEPGKHAQIVNEFLERLLTEWNQDGRRGW